MNWKRGLDACRAYAMAASRSAARRDPVAGTERLVVFAETRSREAAVRERIRLAIQTAAVTLFGGPAEEIVLLPPHGVLKTSTARSGAMRRWHAGSTRAICRSNRAGASASRSSRVRAVLMGAIRRNRTVRVDGRRAAARRAAQLGFRGAREPVVHRACRDPAGCAWPGKCSAICASCAGGKRGTGIAPHNMTPTKLEK